MQLEVSSEPNKNKTPFTFFSSLYFQLLLVLPRNDPIPCFFLWLDIIPYLPKFWCWKTDYSGKKVTNPSLVGIGIVAILNYA